MDGRMSINTYSSSSHEDYKQTITSYNRVDSGGVEEEKEEIPCERSSQVEKPMNNKKEENRQQRKLNTNGFSLNHKQYFHGSKLFNRHESRRKFISIETATERWLTRGNRDLWQQWKKYEDYLEKKNRPITLLPSKLANASTIPSLRDKIQQFRLPHRNKRSMTINSHPDEVTETTVDMDEIVGAWTEETQPTSPKSDCGTPTWKESPHSDPELFLPSCHHTTKVQGENNHTTSQNNQSLQRLSRTVRYGRRGELPIPTSKTNQVRLHVYDLITNDTIMQLPFGCDFPIGRCFQSINNGLQALGTGAYHCGIEVNGIEYAYGANDFVGATGVFTCVPKHSPGYQHRALIDFGRRTLSNKKWVTVSKNIQDETTGTLKTIDTYEQVEEFIDGHDVLRQMALEYRGTDYDLLENNCCTFARDACLRLGIPEEEIPTWFMHLANLGAITRDAAQKTFTAALGRKNAATSATENTATTCPNSGEPYQTDEMDGFEVVWDHSNANILVMDSIDEIVQDFPNLEIYGVRRTRSWTY
jgi:PPPDE putative peptidase domain